MKGTVKFFNISKGFGFITGEDGKDYFVHHSALPEGAKLHDNDAVDFKVEKGDRGLKAVDVTVSGESAAPSKAKKEEPAEDEDVVEDEEIEEEE